MADHSRIEWTDRTFNPWIGCTRVSQGCVHCYAETFAARYKKAEWGPLARRVKTGDAYWRKPLAWNNETWGECRSCGWRGKDLDLAVRCPVCQSEGVRDTRQRVFCASLADVFEVNPQVADWRAALFALIERTPNLDWLLLTKRPEKIFSLGTSAVGEVFDNWLARTPNVWLGTTVESGDVFETRVSALVKNGVHAAVRFLSVEPMISPVRLTPTPVFSSGWWEFVPGKKPKVDWVICGGESGSGCRPMDVEWARTLRDDCTRFGVSFFMKQLGGYPRKRDRLEDFPEDLRVREYPSPQIEDHNLGGEG